MCVLVVEDELLIRMDLAITLEDAGHDVLCASHGPEALSLASLHPRRFTAVLADLNMPGGMTGADVVTELRREYPTIPMFIVTAQAPAVAAEFVVLHRVCIVGKPYDSYRLVQRLGLALADQRALGDAGPPTGPYLLP